MADFSDYIEKMLQDKIKQRTELCLNMDRFLSSEHGQAFFDLIGELVNQLKDDFIFADSEEDRKGMRESMIALNKLRSLIVELAKEHELRVVQGQEDREDPQGMVAIDSYAPTIGAGFEE